MTIVRAASLGVLSRIAASQHGLVTRAQAAGAGCSDEVLESLCEKGGLRRVHRGVYRFTSVATSFEQRVLAACLTCGDGIACRITAMQLYGFDISGAARPPDVLSHRTTHQPRAGGFVVHTTRRPVEGEFEMHAGVPVTTPVRTLRDVAGVVTPAALDRFVGFLVATRKVRPAELLVLTGPGAGGPRRPRPGSRRLRLAVESMGVTTAPDSVLEHRALVLLRAAGLPEPVAQFPVHAHGRLVGLVDFAWPDRGVVLEVDGYRWHAEPSAFAGDRRRDNQMRDLGWAVYRTTAQELETGATVLLRQLGRALEVPPSRSHPVAAVRHTPENCKQVG